VTHLAQGPEGLDIAACHRAVNARDRRFDGVFFVAITTTRVYCRPPCPSRAASPRNRRFYASPAEAERDGFRPCLRCRPELAPGRAAIDAVGRLARVAARRIAAGALNGRGVAALAKDLGVSERHLRRALDREFGLSPIELAQTHRLLLAKQLLADTALPVTQVAYASGFQSLRRFNALVRARYRVTPGALRRRSRDRREEQADEPAVVLSLDYRPPYDWHAMLAWLSGRATPGVEMVALDHGGTYRRTVRLRGHTGVIGLRAATGRDAVRVDVSPGLIPVLAPLLARLRRLLDLDAEPRAVAAHLGGDPSLAPLIARRPGLRVPGALDGFEVALRAVLGQQVSGGVAALLAGRLVREVAAPLDPRIFPELTHHPLTAEALAAASPERVARIGIPRKRAECIVALATAVAEGRFPELTADTPGADPGEFRQRFLELPGIGPWTAEYVAMRALAWPDAFPEGDLVLQRATGSASAKRLRAASERWRPWRSYAAQHLWTGMTA
jgi:AraC family transcriptional regulator of adaptative response / DNA-3-methyladenine glycosylase II